MQLVSSGLRVFVLAGLLWLAVSDVRYRRLANAWVVAIGAAFLIFAALQQLGWHAFGMHLLSGGVALLIGLALFALRVLGGGDAKLLSVLFLWSGPLLAAPMLTVISLTGTVVGILSFATRRLEPGKGSGVVRVLALFSAVRGVPYGVAIASGGSCMVLWPWILPGLMPLLMTQQYPLH
ncbi:hypothetical protein WM40_17815 [Robbsia andropogonis]|uniref:Prepilin type IV endopeptidase peptidase domain-containing protein n=1 Tax=Robbsia andropogonis TaxID=28092 RepID=A0A0F5JWY0_9BURK|nr:hypothetical protein WM40_17815 [Robbsia andropogonis]